MSSVQLPLAAYRGCLALDAPFRPLNSPGEPDRLDELARAALACFEDDHAAGVIGITAAGLRRVVSDADDDIVRRLLRAILNVRRPGPRPANADALLDALLGGEREARGIVDPDMLAPITESLAPTSYAASQAVLWQGDITTLAVDAVVNAANSELLGCFLPFHPCVDNAIHTAAGPRLRDDCHSVVRLQGHPERTGIAKITRGYHLAARYVLHTVGPIARGQESPAQQAMLASSYNSCLDLAAEMSTIRSLAFCSVSTGTFGYPGGAAARVALAAVEEWLARHPGALDLVVFNVFTSEDHEIYERTIRGW